LHPEQTGLTIGRGIALCLAELPFLFIETDSETAYDKSDNWNALGSLSSFCREETHVVHI
jgi:hypothetical protein